MSRNPLPAVADDDDDAAAADAPMFLFSGNACVIGNSGAGKSCMLKRFWTLPNINNSSNMHLPDFTLEMSPTIGLDFFRVCYQFRPTSVDELVKVPASPPIGDADVRQRAHRDAMSKESGWKRSDLPALAKLDLTLYDTAGQERFRSITYSHMRNKDVVFFVFDATSEDSLSALVAWSDKVTTDNGGSAPLCVLVGTKCDLLPGDTVEARHQAAMRRHRDGLDAVLPRLEAKSDSGYAPLFWYSAKSGVGSQALFDTVAHYIFARSCRHHCGEVIGGPDGSARLGGHGASRHHRGTGLRVLNRLEDSDDDSDTPEWDGRSKPSSSSSCASCAS